MRVAEFQSKINSHWRKVYPPFKYPYGQHQISISTSGAPVASLALRAIALTRSRLVQIERGLVQTRSSPCSFPHHGLEHFSEHACNRAAAALMADQHQRLRIMGELPDGHVDE